MDQSTTPCVEQIFLPKKFARQSPDHATAGSIPYSYFHLNKIRGSGCTSLSDSMCSLDLLCARPVWGCDWGYSTHGGIPLQKLELAIVNLGLGGLPFLILHTIFQIE